MDEDDKDSVAVPDTPPLRRPPMSVGALLAETRAAAGRELADIARETRVPLRHLMAIEADDHRALPALPYALGFVKNYARSIGLDAEAVAAQFRAETSLTPHVPSAPVSPPMEEARLPSRSLAWGSLGLLAAVVVGLGLYGAGVFDAPPPPPPPVASPVDVAPPVTAPPAAAAPVDPAAVPPAGAATAGAAPAAASAAAPAIPTAGPVVLLAREDVWVKIYDRTTRRRAFMGVLPAGERYAVPAGSDLVLRAGKAGMIEVSVAGVKLPPLGGPVETVDGVVLTAPALAARFDPAAAPPAPPAVRLRRAPVQLPAMPAPAKPVTAQPAPAAAPPQPANPGA
jgi:cytoskeletal protein RodZ